MLAMLRGSMKALTTKGERREFLHETDEGDAEPEKESTTNRRAAFKLARVLADPRTPVETRDEIELLVRELSMSSGVTVEHPALIRRAFQLMCEAKPKGRMRERNKDRRNLLALLDSITDGRGVGDE
jgi:nucleotidyltransferase/DNA polymerase involved in DNA repair